MSITNDRTNSQSLANSNEPRSKLQSFTSISNHVSHRDSHGKSSRANSSRSRRPESPAPSLRRRDDSPQPPTRSLLTADSPLPDQTPAKSINGSIRQPKRSSGGFLLDSSTVSTLFAGSVSSLRDAKGKSKDMENGLSVPKRRGLRGTQDRPISVASSGLHSDTTMIEELPLQARQDVSGDHADIQTSSSYAQSASYGFNTDPAQIVSMALALNEGRRRQASGQRLASNTTQGLRIASNYTNKSGNGVGTSNAIERYVHTRRRPSISSSLNPQPMTPQKTHRELLQGIDARGGLTNATETLSSPDDSMSVSRATQNRVQKAKTYFELAQEYRRLLSHLPPLRRPDVKSMSTPLGSKAYNPLQYARNRKLRFREQQPLDAENEGWHDVVKVRAWVNAVIESHAETQHDPLECVRLPPLSLQDEGDGEDDDDNSDSNKRKKPQPGKPRRPKSDWVTFPGDLLADAHWTEQGLNKRKIYDRDNQPIYPSDTQFRFSGWRNRTPVDVPENLKSSSPEISPTSKVKDLGSPPSLPTFEPVNNDNEKRKSKFKRSLGRKKSTQTKKRVFDSSSDSEASVQNEEPDHGEERRGRDVLRKLKKLDMPDGDPFAQGAASAPITFSLESTSTSNETDRPTRTSSQYPKDLLKRIYRRDNSEHAASGTKSDPSSKRSFIDSLGLKRSQDARQSFEDDSTAPSSPIAYGVPSIAIDLSSPHSRSPSPTKKGRDYFGIKDRSKDRSDRIERTDFAEHGSHNSSRVASLVPEILVHASSGEQSPRSRGPSPFSRRRSASSFDRHNDSTRDLHRESSISKVSSKTVDSGHRIRAVFKGGRIAELVGNEVSRVGDYIWKREVPRRTIDGGSISGYESDSEEDVDHVLKTHTHDHPKKSPPSTNLSPQSVRTTNTPKSASPEQFLDPKYHFQGLPSFTSPFERDRDAQHEKAREQSPGGTTIFNNDEQTQMTPSLTSANARRSPRLDRLQPARIDTSMTYSPPDRRKSYGFSQALDLTRTQSASELFNDAIHSRGRRRESRAVDAAHLPSMAIPTNEMTKIQSTDSEASKHKPITMQDVLRARALLLMTAVKASKIIDRYEEYPQPQSLFLVRTLQHCDPTKLDDLRVKRKEEHQVAVTALIAKLGATTTGFNAHLTSFGDKTAANLHKDLQILEDTADTALFPRLRDLSDQTGRLAQSLTTTSTLAVRSVNDEIADAAKLKRRGVIRIGRRLGFKIAEWAVVGLLWFIWLVATIIRFWIGVVRLLWSGFAWLFWLK